ncbi:MAG: CHAT domain-containing protein, partial [Verrucomicrobia bacterium]|nr:CHAT domain-containing protein [Verrucomicrobiota bacterium]
AELRLQEGRFSEAEQFLIEIVNQDAKTEYPSNWEAWHLLGSAEQGLGKNDEALKHFKQSIDIIEKRRQVTAGTPGELNFLQRYHEAYQSLIELLIKTENLPEAYDYIELEKVTELQQGTLPPGLSEDSQGAAYRKGRSLQFSETAIEREIAEEGKKDSPDVMRIANLEKLRRVINQEFIQFLHGLEAGQNYAQIRQQLLANPRELYRSIHDLPEDVFVLQPVLLPRQKKIVILVYHRGIPIKREVSIPDDAKVRELIDKFLNFLSEEPSTSSGEEAFHRLTRIKEIGNQLYQWFIAPIADQLRSAKLLVISPSGNLRKIPFQALYDGNHFLIEAYPIVTLGLGSGPAGSLPKKLDIFAVADPDGTLPGTEDQVLKLKEMFPDAQVLRQQDATKASLEWDETEKKYNVLVFATHCAIDDDKPTASFIQLAGKGEDKKLTYDEIGGFGSVWEPGPYPSNSEWRGVRLAVLSACSTAVDLTTEDWAVQGFAAQFELIGISWVAASLWPVEDHSTTELMNDFFQNLQNGKSMANSLQAAQVSLIHSSNYSDPFYWSPFILIGGWR